MTIEIKSPGVHATIQDLGRIRTQKYGIPVSGAMDTFALRIANLLVQNEQEEACVEVMFYGTSVTFTDDHLIAITGGYLQPMINGKSVQMWRPIFVEKGSTLRFKGAKRGCFAYLAVAGGCNVPVEIGSKSTYTRANIGGIEGRALQKGDTIQTGTCSEKNADMKRVSLHASNTWYVNQTLVYKWNPCVNIRIVKGSEYSAFTEDSVNALTSDTFTLTTQADRMGYTFDGAKLEKKQSEELLSEGVTFGTIQVPASGKPIILMADRQTTGGYFKIGQVISADLPKLAQLQPGNEVTFELVSVQEAENALFEIEEHITEVSIGIQLKM